MAQQQLCHISLPAEFTKNQMAGKRRRILKPCLSAPLSRHQIYDLSRNLSRGRPDLYLTWPIAAILTILPIFVEPARPLWRILLWVGPTALALEVNAGNHRWVYITKGILWVAMMAAAQFVLFRSDGFKESTKLPKEFVCVLTAVLISCSCILTIIGSRLKQVNWCGHHPNVRRPHGLNAVDTKKYIDLKNGTIETPLSLKDLQNTWTTTYEGETDLSAEEDQFGRRTLSAEEVSTKVVRISLVTQFVMSRVFKTDNNQVLVYSMVTHYRAMLVLIALLMAGLWHVFDAFFSQGGQKTHDLVERMILWTTLPTLTLPQLVRVMFGAVELKFILRGMLPVSNDRQMWERLDVSARDLYTALTNAVNAEVVLRERLGLVWSRGDGSGPVKVQDVMEARKLCVESLLRVGKFFVRVSDGRHFEWYAPSQLKVAGDTESSTDSSRSFPTRSSFDTEQSWDGDYFLSSGACWTKL